MALGSRYIRVLRHVQHVPSPRPFLSVNSTRIACRFNSTSSTLKYADKIKAKMNQEGVDDLSALKDKLKREGRWVNETPVGDPSASSSRVERNEGPEQPSTPKSLDVQSPKTEQRKDSSPVKPLDSFFNTSAILKKPHTTEQINALWTLYHASKSGGTGRGYICATIPVNLYETMAERAKKYPIFIVPLQRINETDPPSDPSTEFHFLQWDFHSPPEPPRKDVLSEGWSEPGPSSPPAPNPSISTVIFTPLAQYQRHGSFATPYLVLTHYTDLVASHGIVLLRGEITPSTSGGEGQFVLGQNDAQQLGVMLQKFYLGPVDGSKEDKGYELLKLFHERPEEFEWERLVQ